MNSQTVWILYLWLILYLYKLGTKSNDYSLKNKSLIECFYIAMKQGSFKGKMPKTLGVKQLLRVILNKFK